MQQTIKAEKRHCPENAWSLEESESLNNEAAASISTNKHRRVAEIAFKANSNDSDQDDMSGLIEILEEPSFNNGVQGIAETIRQTMLEIAERTENNRERRHKELMRLFERYLQDEIYGESRIKNNHHKNVLNVPKVVSNTKQTEIVTNRKMAFESVSPVVIKDESLKSDKLTKPQNDLELFRRVQDDASEECKIEEDLQLSIIYSREEDSSTQNKIVDEMRSYTDTSIDLIDERIQPAKLTQSQNEYQLLCIDELNKNCLQKNDDKVRRVEGVKLKKIIVDTGTNIPIKGGNVQQTTSINEFQLMREKMLAIQRSKMADRERKKQKPFFVN